MGLFIESSSPIISLWFFACKINNFFPLVVLARRKVCLDSNEEHTILVLWEHLLPYQIKFDPLWTDIECSSSKSPQLTPRMHRKPIELGRVLCTKTGAKQPTPVELRENLLAPKFGKFRIFKLLLKQLTSYVTMNMMFRYEVWSLLACYHEGWPSCQKILSTKREGGSCLESFSLVRRNEGQNNIVP